MWCLLQCCRHFCIVNNVYAHREHIQCVWMNSFLRNEIKKKWEKNVFTMLKSFVYCICFIDTVNKSVCWFEMKKKNFLFNCALNASCNFFSRHTHISQHIHISSFVYYFFFFFIFLFNEMRWLAWEYIKQLSYFSFNFFFLFALLWGGNG